MKIKKTVVRNAFFVGLPVLVALAFSCKEEKVPQQKPNVLFISVDDMNGWGVKDLYPEVHMPNFEKLRAESYNFTKAICPSPVCVPSRAAFFSGVAPHRSGAYYNGCDPWKRSEILKTVETIPECFKRNGYTTFGRGKIFHARMEEGREEAMFDNRPIYKGGFGPFGEEETWVGGNGKFQSVKAWEGPNSDFPDVKNTDAAIEFIQQDHENPFFCYVGLWRPHTPYTAPKQFFDLYDETKVTYPESYLENDLEDVPVEGRDLVDSLRFFGANLEERHKIFKKMIYGYLATSSFADWAVGRVMAALDNSPYVENTIVVVASDNGYHMGEKERWQKGTLWELSAYTPLLIRLPNGESVELPQTVSLMDIYPTLIEYCNLDAPSHKLDGQSLLKFINDHGAESGNSFMSYGESYSSVYDGRYRYIRYPSGEDELYDHENDPYEWTNIIKNTENRMIIEALSKEIPASWAPSLGGRTEANKGRVGMGLNPIENASEKNYKDEGS